MAKDQGVLRINAGRPLSAGLSNGVARLEFAPAEGGRPVELSIAERDAPGLARAAHALATAGCPEVFSAPGPEAASRIILTPQDGQDTDERWARETPALVSMLRDVWDLGPGLSALDYGCGAGRLSREMCALGCGVVGVDVSPGMRRLASDNARGSFLAVSPATLDCMVADGVRFDCAVAVWVLQHCRRPEEDADRLASVLAPGGGLFVVNNRNSRAVPANSGWDDDGVDVWGMLDNRLERVRDMEFPKWSGVDNGAFRCSLYRKKEG